MMNEHTIFEIRWQNALDLRTNHRLTALKLLLTDFLICSIIWVEDLSVCGNLSYTGHFSEPNLVLTANYIHLHVLVQVILSSGYPFFKRIILMKLVSFTKNTPLTHSKSEF